MAPRTAGSSASRRRTSPKSWSARSSNSRARGPTSHRSWPAPSRITSASRLRAPPISGWCCRPTPRRRRSRFARSPTPSPPRFRPTVLSRARQLDKGLVASVAALALYGLATLYSAGQTDVPTFVATIWRRQVVWLGLGLIVAVLTFRTSPRMLEWATPFVYAIALFLLLLTLVIGTGAGTAAGSKSWLAIGGLRFGQARGLAQRPTIPILPRLPATLCWPPPTPTEL